MASSKLFGRPWLADPDLLDHVPIRFVALLTSRQPAAGFSVRIADGTAQIDMIDHHATSEAARAAVEPFLRAWELSAALQQGPGEFQFVYDSARVIDRDPPAGPVQAASVLESARLTASAAAHVCRANYPPAPLDLARDAAVDLMFDRYCMYREHRTMLADAANYCLTVLETAAGGRSPAARRYVIAQKVLARSRHWRPPKAAATQGKPLGRPSISRQPSTNGSNRPCPLSYAAPLKSPSIPRPLARRSR